MTAVSQRAGLDEQPATMLELTDVGPTTTVHTFCRYCTAACGIEVTVRANKVLKIAPDKQNPHTWNDFCSKGRTAAELVGHPRRILNPMNAGG